FASVSEDFSLANSKRSLHFDQEFGNLETELISKIQLNQTQDLLVLPSGKVYGGPHTYLIKNKRKDSHHIIQDAAVKDLPYYSREQAINVQLEGPSIRIGTEHYKATQVQRKSGGGTYGIERRIGYRALREAGIKKEEARILVEEADKYFNNIGITKETQTRLPGNRNKTE
ncbi:MAG: hypothetical protein JSS34_08915, partial [Proteobacteria bacterium]|nr:hypothetical protein [Pseudomonadota bacterium]